MSNSLRLNTGISHSLTGSFKQHKWPEPSGALHGGEYQAHGQASVQGASDQIAAASEPHMPTPEERAHRREEHLLRDFAERYGVEEKRGTGQRQQADKSDMSGLGMHAEALQPRHPRAGQSSASELAGEDWFQPPPRRPTASVTRRVLARVIFALGLMMCAGAVSLIFFAPPAEQRVAEIPAAPAAPVVKTGGEAPAPAPAAPLPSVEVAQSTAIAPEAGRLNATETAAAAGEPRIAPVGGITVLRPRLPEPVSTGSIAVLPEPTVVNPVYRAASVEVPGLQAAGGAAAGSTVSLAATRQLAAPVPVQAAPPVASFAPLAEPSNETLSRILARAPVAAAANQETQSRGSSVDAGQSAAPVPAARATTFVNMRAGPDNDEAVVAVVPAEAELEVVECTNWCEVIFDGKRGWIYSKFVQRSRAAFGSGNG